jgi:heme o synthase
MILADDPADAGVSLVARFRALAALSRVKLSLAVAGTAVAGFVSVSHLLTWRTLVTFAGVALLSAAASAFNQLQERGLDAAMERTRLRPLITRQISPSLALAFAIGSALAGFAILFFYTTPLATLLGGFSLAWYCALYTPLKRKTLFALPVGALTGALAPVIGCVAATGRICVPAIGIACFLFFWQVPHFLLMLLKYGHEYEKAGFPFMSISKNEDRFKRIVFVWCAAVSASSLVFPLFGLVYGQALVAALVVLNVLFIFFFCFKMVTTPKSLAVDKAFRSMYLFQGCVLALVILQGIFPGL